MGEAYAVRRVVRQRTDWEVVIGDEENTRYRFDGKRLWRHYGGRRRLQETMEIDSPEKALAIARMLLDYAKLPAGALDVRVDHPKLRKQ